MDILKVHLRGKVLKENFRQTEKIMPVEIIKKFIGNDLKIQKQDFSYLIVKVFKHTDDNYVGFDAYIVAPRGLGLKYAKNIEKLTRSNLSYSSVFLTKPTLFDFIEIADSNLSYIVEQGYKDDENTISFSLIKAPLTFLSYLGINPINPVKKKKSIKSIVPKFIFNKITGKEETEYGDLALIVKMRNGMEGIAFYEAKLSKTDKSKFDEYSSISSKQLRKYKGNEAFTQYLFYGIDKNNGQYYAICKPLDIVAYEFLDKSKPIEASSLEKSFSASFFDNLRGFGLKFDSNLVRKIKDGNIKFRYILEFDEVNDILQSKVYETSVQNLNLNYNDIEN